MCLGVGRTRVPLRTAETAERRGFPDAGPQVVLSDGAKWIWRLAGVQFPRAVSIVDLYHAKEKLWEVARALGLGRGPLRGSRRGERLDGLMATLRAHAAACPQADRCSIYIETNRERMRYRQFRAQGLVGSGVVEAGCKSHAASS